MNKMSLDFILNHQPSPAVRPRTQSTSHVRSGIVRTIQKPPQRVNFGQMEVQVKIQLKFQEVVQKQLNKERNPLGVRIIKSSAPQTKAEMKFVLLTPRTFKQVYFNSLTQKPVIFRNFTPKDFE
jgi:ACT domain-containing protein